MNKHSLVEMQLPEKYKENFDVLSDREAPSSRAGRSKIARVSRGIQEERKIMATKRFSNNSESASYFRAKQKISLPSNFPSSSVQGENRKRRNLLFSTKFPRGNLEDQIVCMGNEGNMVFTSILEQ